MLLLDGSETGMNWAATISAEPLFLWDPEPHRDSIVSRNLFWGPPGCEEEWEDSWHGPLASASYLSPPTQSIISAALFPVFAASYLPSSILAWFFNFMCPHPKTPTLEDLEQAPPTRKENLWGD